MPDAAVVGLAFLLGCGVAIAQQFPQQQYAKPNFACGLKGGEWQSYWTEEAAIRDGAILIRAGNCPAKRSYE